MTDKNKPKGGKSGPDAPRGADEVDPIIGEAVGSRLKNLFDDFASEAVPDRFFDLIDQLEKKEPDTSSSKEQNAPDGADKGSES